MKSFIPVTEPTIPKDDLYTDEWLPQEVIDCMDAEEYSMFLVTSDPDLTESLASTNIVQYPSAFLNPVSWLSTSDLMTYAGSTYGFLTVA